jgi:hypothetical protein
MHFKKNLAVLLAEFYRLPHNYDLRSYWHQPVQFRDILRIKPDTAMTDPSADTPRPVCTMNEDRPARETQRMGAERVVRTRRDLGRETRPLFQDGFRDIPGRVDPLFNDGKDPKRRLAPFIADADGEGKDKLGVRVRIIVQAQFRQINDNSLLTGQIGQDPESWYSDGSA